MNLIIYLWCSLSLVSCAYTVMLDAGHGGKDPGASGIHGLTEKTVSLMFSKDLADALSAYEDVEILQTRRKDVFTRLSKRIAFARSHPIDLFISLHMDKGSKPQYRGISVYVQSKQSALHTIQNYVNDASKKNLLGNVADAYKLSVASMVMQSSIDDSVSLGTLMLRRLAKRGYVLHNPRPISRELFLFHQHVPNMLIELGYISNKEDVALILDKSKRVELAKTIAASVHDFLVKVRENIDK